MNDLKYVIVITKHITNLDMARAIVFNGLVTHSQVVDKNQFKVLSAGFCVIGTDKKTNKLAVKCWGKSVSLNVDSNIEFDQQVVRKTLTRQHSYF